MAHYIERHLKDKATEEFLADAGFVLQPSCQGSFWQGHGQFFTLNEDVVITSLGQLFNHFKKETYDLAYNHGRAQALATLYEKMNDLVFVPPEVNYNKLTQE